MKMNKAILIAGLLFAAPVLAAEEVENVTIEPGKVHEICMKLEFGKRLTYSFMSSRTMNFNIHYHEGEQAIYPLNEHPTNEEAEIFTAQKDQDHCMMWTNTNENRSRLNVIYEVR